MPNVKNLCLVLAAATLGVLSAACASPSQPAAPAAQPGAQSGGTEPKVQRLVIAVTGASSGPETNIGSQVGSPDSWLVRPMYEQLLETDATTGKYLPGLATSWTLASDAKTITAKLREGVQFHQNMGEMTADDVVHSFDVQLAAESNSTNKTFFTGAKADGKYQVTIGQPTPYALWQYAISRENTVFIQSKAWFDKNGLPKKVTDPAVPGTAPYQEKEWVQGSRIVFERAPFKHWRQTPDFPELEYRFQKEASTRVAALLTGEVHITQIPEDLKPQAEKGGMKVVAGTLAAQRAWLRFHGIYVDAKNPGQYLYPNNPLMDVKVRKALNKAINRDDLYKAFFNSKGEVMLNGPFHKTREGWDPSWETRWKAEYGYDPAAAQALLAEAGYTTAKPLETNLVLTNVESVPSSQDVQEAVVQFWRKAGIKVNIVQMDPGQRIATDRDLKFDNHISLAASNSDVIVGWQVYNDSIPPRFGAESHTTDALFLKARSEIDAEKRSAVLKEIGEYAFANQMNIPLFWLPTEVVLNPQVVAGYTFPGNITGFWTHVENIKAVMK